MKSRERVLLAMNLHKGDRVPLMCQFSIGFMMNQLQPDPVQFWYDGKTFAEGLLTLRELFNFDGILVSLHGHSSNWKNGLLREERISEGKTKLYYANRVETHTWEDLPLVEYMEESAKISVEDINIDAEIPDKLDYIPVSGNLYFHLSDASLYSIFDYLEERTGGEYSIHGEITSPFDYFLDKFGYENGLMGLLLFPEKCKQILQKYTEGVKAIAKGMCHCPIDAIKISSSFAGQGFISTEQYQEFVQPYESQIIEVIKREGKKVYIHTCGSIGDRLELMRSSGASGLECLDPLPVGNVDLEDAFARIGNDMFIKGNIDSVNTLLFGSEDKIREDVGRILSIGKNKGLGFILSTACSIAPNVPRKNVQILYELIQKYGLY